jgi:anti-sigma regulatory factor (Ser/Thr protein kinase)
MRGMALATSFSYVCGFLVILNHYRRKDRILHFTTKGLKLRDLGDVFLRGMPNAINMGCSALRIFAFNTLILSISDKTAVAGLSIANNAFSFIFSLVLGMFVTASILSSLYFSEEDRRGLEHVATLSVRITIVLFIGVGLLIAIFPRPVAMLFVRPDAVGAVDQGARFIRFWAIQFLFMAVSFPVSGMYQGTGHLKQNYLIDVMREGVLPIVCVTGLGKAFGLRGAEIGFAVAGLLTLVLLYLVPTVCNRRFPLKAKDFLILSEDFGAKPEELYEASMHDMDEVIKVSEEVRKFCIDRGTDAGKSMMLALFIEEMAGNTITYGFAEGRRGTVDLRFVLHEGTGAIRLRDDGKPFDPVMWLDKNSAADPASGLGIRMVTKLAKEVHYMASMEMNNLMITL